MKNFTGSEIGRTTQPFDAIGNLFDPDLNPLGILCQHLDDILTPILAGLNLVTDKLRDSQKFRDFLLQQDCPADDRHKQIFDIMPDIANKSRHFC